MSFYYKYVNKNNEKRKLKEKLKHKTIYESDNVLLSPSKNSDDSLNFEDSISNLKPSHYDKDDLCMFFFDYPQCSLLTDYCSKRYKKC